MRLTLGDEYHKLAPRGFHHDVIPKNIIHSWTDLLRRRGKMQVTSKMLPPLGHALPRPDGRTAKMLRFPRKTTQNQVEVGLVAGARLEVASR